MIRLCIAFFVFFLLPAVASAQTDPGAASKFISELSDKAVTILRDQSVSLEAREDKLRKIVSESLDIETIGKFAIDKSWERATQDERDEYLELFSTYILQIYTQRLGGYTGQTLKIDNSTAYKDRDAVVQTTIIQEGSDNMDVKWLVRDSDNDIRILDVIVDGKSLALAQRKEFANIIARDKLSGLINLLRLKVSKYSAQS
ncbi:MAG: ABC transporter substrate-binding protein [Alphaproteobacteria bacterium]|nr:ABC transporter substrate-binding protein [Alphaproteobacteria bacterium]